MGYETLELSPMEEGDWGQQLWVSLGYGHTPTITQVPSRGCQVHWGP